MTVSKYYNRGKRNEQRIVTMRDGHTTHGKEHHEIQKTEKKSKATSLKCIGHPKIYSSFNLLVIHNQSTHPS